MRINQPENLASTFMTFFTIIFQISKSLIDFLIEVVTKIWKYGKSIGYIFFW